MHAQRFLLEAGMARRTGRAALKLSEEHKAMLDELAGSRTSPAREVERARVLLAYADGQSPRRYSARWARPGRRSTSASTRPWRRGWRRGCRIATTDRMRRKSPMTLAPGSWTWPVASPRTWATPRSFGRCRRWPRCQRERAERGLCATGSRGQDHGMAHPRRP